MRSFRRRRHCASPIRTSGQSLYDWSFISLDGKAVPRRERHDVAPDASIEGEPGFTTLIVCAGNHPTQYLDRRLLNWLRRLDRYGTALGALDTGSFALAAAGLMKGLSHDLHWEAMPSSMSTIRISMCASRSS